MERFFIGDMHLGHANIIKYSDRPFANVNEMDNMLIKNWNNKVGHKDEVYILGDFALTGRTKTEEYLCALNGIKYLLKGNHDHWISNGNCQKYLQWIKDYYEVKENGNIWVLSHYPFYSWNKRHAGAIHLHAHTHGDINLTVVKDETQTHARDWNDGPAEVYNRYKCVSAECTGYTPISTTELKNYFCL